MIVQSDLCLNFLQIVIIQMLPAKPEGERPVCSQHGIHIRLVCIDSHCSVNPLVCSICLGQKKDYHKTNKGLVHSLRQLYPLIDKTIEIQKASSDLTEKIQKLVAVYFDHLKENLKIVVEKAEKETLHRIRCNTAPSSLSKADAEVMDNLRHGAFDQILPKNLLDGADKIMSCEIDDNFPQLVSNKKQLQSLIENKFVENCLKQISSSDVMFKLLLMGKAFHEPDQPNRSPLLEYDSIITSYHKLQGPYEWRNCGQCSFYVAAFKEEMPGSEKMYRDLATHQKKACISLEHPGNGGCFNSDASKQSIYKSAASLTNQIKEKLGLKEIWKDLLVIHGKPQGWAYNAEEGAMNAFGGPAGKGYSFCRGGEKVKKKIHLFVFN